MLLANECTSTLSFPFLNINLDYSFSLRDLLKKLLSLLLVYPIPLLRRREKAFFRTLLLSSTIRVDEHCRLKRTNSKHQCLDQNVC